MGSLGERVSGHLSRDVARSPSLSSGRDTAPRPHASWGRPLRVPSASGPEDAPALAALAMADTACPEASAFPCILPFSGWVQIPSLGPRGGPRSKAPIRGSPEGAVTPLTCRAQLSVPSSGRSSSPPHAVAVVPGSPRALCRRRAPGRRWPTCAGPSQRHALRAEPNRPLPAAAWVPFLRFVTFGASAENGAGRRREPRSSFRFWSPRPSQSSRQAATTGKARSGQARPELGVGNVVR